MDKSGLAAMFTREGIEDQAGFTKPATAQNNARITPFHYWFCSVPMPAPAGAYAPSHLLVGIRMKADVFCVQP